MGDFEVWFDAMVEASEAFATGDFARLSRLTSSPPPPDELARHVRTLCERSAELPRRLSQARIGRLLWFLMGAGEQVWHDVAQASEEEAVAAILSLERLYADLFAPLLQNPKDGTTAVDHPLGTACYMLWDMDGGLETIPMGQSSGPLVDACFQVLSSALVLDSPACMLSALHGLGHLSSGPESRAGRIVEDLLRRRDAALPEHLRVYARAAIHGCVS